MENKVSNSHILYEGTATPYLAIFNSGGMPINNPITGIPLGVYISNWSYRYDEEKENLATITFDTGDPDTVDIQDLQEGSTIYLQWGYIYPDGQFISSPVRSIKIRDLDCTFDSSGTHVTIKCIDTVGDLRFQPPYSFSDNSEYSLSTFLDNGCNEDIGVIIEIFE